jgi:hypothetical protein
MSLIIALSGKKHSGKSTVVNHLKKMLISGYVENNFADTLKIIIFRTLVPVEVITPNDTPIEWIDSHKLYELPCGLTVRQALQVLGTDVFRAMWEPVWINAWKHRLPPSEGPKSPGTVLVGDVRFPNEVEAVQALGGKVIRLTRAVATEDSHTSETALDVWNNGLNHNDGGGGFDAVIDNARMTEEQANKAVWDVIFKNNWLPRK